MYKCPKCGYTEKLAQEELIVRYFDGKGARVDFQVLKKHEYIICCRCGYDARETEFEVNYYEKQLRHDAKRLRSAY